MATKDYEFTVGKGHQVISEKSHYPDLVRLVIPKDQALDLAQKILRQLEHVRPDQTHLGEIALFGQLEVFDDE
ncbi:hypothetical protein ACVXHM_17015 [Pseudomonas aeruginosa]|uniref:Uncharacterized protein n=2 Tax=Pseudomonadaceae TaxID=135621 RepID=A0A379PLF4_ECTOL|nr:MULTISPECIES: hypothetical protein [Pseudomonas]OWG38420.1 hypothetical protein CAQ69_09735 [Stutzerimonas stutzeri]OZB34682.1 MAG: hypothetical protein B7X51_01440 [Pseudomonas sp. 34-62-33]ELQ8317459.1 hypothetical protein [Pseudomonas aeruginosa]MBI6905399.1 hypothetical protein [Pseudomonas aeruginosa]MBP7824371.1 hypothetical protein [Pseudomonas sp.]